MAHEAVAKGRLTGFGGMAKYDPVTPYLVTYETPNNDLTIKTPASGSRIAVVGLVVLNDAAYNLSFKSGTTIIQTLKFGANSGISHPFNPASPLVLVTTEAGEALKVNSSVALPPFMLYTLEF